MLRLVIAIASLAAIVRSIPIDNGVQGDPEIDCGPTSISVTFNTAKPFSGHVYVKNLFSTPGCRTDGANDRSIGQIELPFDTCNVQRVRSLDPKGIFVRSTVVISFHPNFMTKIDRAYTIQCFYMEADKTVSTDIEVSMITTGFQTQVVPMPVCRYEILDSPTGQVVRFAIIGQPVFHKWTCDTDTVNTFCMTVHTCFVDDGAGDRLDLINEQGCALDKYLMGNLEYPTDLMGVKEVHVFKYNDRQALQFQCQITILVKEPNAQCIRPQCAEPGGKGDGSAGAAPAGRKRRSVQEDESAAGTMDVVSEIETLSIDNDSPSIPSSLANRQSHPAFFDRPVIMTTTTTDGMCVSHAAAYTMIFLMVLLSIACIVTVTLFCLRQDRKQ